jgi:hypothetical protein
VHLVDEDDVALGEIGQDGDEIALAVEARAGDRDQPASVDLPSPGGPANRTWSIGSPRSVAAASAIASCSRTTSWPTKSSSCRGRSERSVSSSSERDAAGPTSRSFSLTPGLRVATRTGRS